MRIRETGLARRDIDRLYLFGLNTYGEKSADAYVIRLLDKFGLICEHPEMARERLEVNPPVRVHPHEAHLIVYRSISNEILILRILPGGADWMDGIFSEI